MHRFGAVHAKAPAHLLDGSRPPEALLAQIAVSKLSGHMPLNRHEVVMSRHGVPIDRSLQADWMGRTGALIAPVVVRMALPMLWCHGTSFGPCWSGFGGSRMGPEIQRGAQAVGPGSDVQDAGSERALQPVG